MTLASGVKHAWLEPWDNNPLFSCNFCWLVNELWPAAGNCAWLQRMLCWNSPRALVSQWWDHYKWLGSPSTWQKHWEFFYFLEKRLIAWNCAYPGAAAPLTFVTWQWWMLGLKYFKSNPCTPVSVLIKPLNTQELPWGGDESWQPGWTNALAFLSYQCQFSCCLIESFKMKCNFKKIHLSFLWWTSSTYCVGLFFFSLRASTDVSKGSTAPSRSQSLYW